MSELAIQNQAIDFWVLKHLVTKLGATAFLRLCAALLYPNDSNEARWFPGLGEDKERYKKRVIALRVISQRLLDLANDAQEPLRTIEEEAAWLQTLNESKDVRTVQGFQASPINTGPVRP